jgi:phage gp36-like protein
MNEPGLEDVPDLLEAECCATCKYRGEEDDFIPWRLHCEKYNCDPAVWMICKSWESDGLLDDFYAGN